MMQYLFKECLNIDLKIPFERIKYCDALKDYASDKPDTRFSLKIKNITDVVKDCSFKIFRDMISEGGVVLGIYAKGAGSYSKKDLNNITRYVEELGAKGLAYFIVDEKVLSPIIKFFTSSEIEKIIKITSAKRGDLLLFIADKLDIASKVLSQLRLYLAQKLNLVDHSIFNFAWVVDFPLFEEDKKEKCLSPYHHPFTQPVDEDIKLLDREPLKVQARAYDLLLNGVEIAGGSIRIHKSEIQEKIFNILKIPPLVAKEKFGFLLSALQYGAPPHGGIALGLDRLCALLLKEETIREVIAFPKTQSGSCPLTDAPYEVSKWQLHELGIKIV